MADLVTMVGDLRVREIGFTSLHERLDTTPGGRLVFHVFAARAEFIRELIVAGTHEGLAVARARGRTGGRPTVVTEDILSAARTLLPEPGRSVTSIVNLRSRTGTEPGDHGVATLCDRRDTCACTAIMADRPPVGPIRGAVTAPDLRSAPFTSIDEPSRQR